MSQSSKKLGLVTLTSLVIANMIGAGVFTTSGFALADLGSPKWVMAGWLVGGLIALCGALSYGGLVRHLTESGGEYLFLARFIHPVVGFLAGWVSLLAGFTGATAFAALGLETYLSFLRPAWLPSGAIAIAVVLLFTALHSFRVSLGAAAQNASVLLKLSLLVVFLVIVFFSPPVSAAPHPVAPFSLLAFAGSLVWVSLSYSGFNAAIYIAGEAEDARRNVPRALWLGALITMVFYLALNAVFVYLPPFQTVVGQPDVAAAAAQAIGGDKLAAFIRVIIALALFTSVSSMIMAGPRVYARMASDGVFPRVFRFTGEVPRAAILLQSALVILVILVSSLKGLLGYLGLTLSLCTALTVSSIFVVRRKEAVIVTGYPFTPVLYVGAVLVFAALSLKRNPWEILGTAFTVASGLCAYWLINRRTPARSRGALS
ncbi:MAG: amino acid permease [Blastocatellia bacterium]|nr:amino acid permease [Blastocatellia bacterium]